MADMLRKSSADWGGGCGRSTCCEPPRAHRRLQHQARRREERQLARDLEADLRDAEERAAYAEKSLDERVAAGGMWEKSDEFYEALEAEDAVRRARSALTAHTP